MKRLLATHLASRNGPLESYSIITQTTCLEGTTPVCYELADELGIGNARFLIPYHEVSFDKQLWKRRIWRAESPVNHTDSTTKTLLHYAIQRDVPEAKSILTGTGSDQFNAGLARCIVHEEDSESASAASLFRKVREPELRKLISRDDEEFWRKRDFIRRDYLSALKNESLEKSSWNFYIRSAVHGESYSLFWDEVRAAASTGHEVRFPFLDYRFSEFIAAIPERLDAELFCDKRIFREPAKALLPASVPDKPEAPLSFSPQCSLLADNRRGTHYLSKEHMLAYELDGSFPEWLRFLEAIDGKRSTVAILRDEMLEPQSIDEFLQIAAQDGILTFTKNPQPA